MIQSLYQISTNLSPLFFPPQNFSTFRKNSTFYQYKQLSQQKTTPTSKDFKEINLTWNDGGIRPRLPEGCDYDKIFTSIDGGVMFIGTKGVLACEIFGDNPKVFLNGKFEKIKLPDPIRPVVEGNVNGHQQQWVKACKSGFGTYTSSSFDQSGPLTETVLMGNLAVRSFLMRNSKDKFIGRKNFCGMGQL